MVIENDCLFTQRTIEILNTTCFKSVLLSDRCLPIKIFAVYTWEKSHTDVTTLIGTTYIIYTFSQCSQYSVEEPMQDILFYRLYKGEEMQSFLLPHGPQLYYHVSCHPNPAAYVCPSLWLPTWVFLRWSFWNNGTFQSRKKTKTTQDILWLQISS